MFVRAAMTFEWIPGVKESKLATVCSSKRTKETFSKSKQTSECVNSVVTAIERRM